MSVLRLLVISTLGVFLASCFEQEPSPEVLPVENPICSVGGTTVSADYQLLWADEFNSGSQPAVEKWNYETGYGSNGWGNDEWQLYTSSPDNVSIENGNLVIAARCTSNCGKRDGTITSARITTQKKFSVKYGKIRARIKMPAGDGMWPAFWMLGENFDGDGWPKSGEIDIVELGHAYGLDNYTTSAAVHWYDDAAFGHRYHSNTLSFSCQLTDDFHIYEVEWDENQVRVKIDGQSYFYHSFDFANQSEFLNDFFLLLNLAVGGTLGGNTISNSWPQKMLVDWVRVYQLKPETEKAIYAESGGVLQSSYNRLVNTSEWGGNSVIANPSSNSVTPLSGSKVLQATYADQGKGWGGLVFNFKRADWSDYSQLNFSLDSSALQAFNNLEIKLEDSRGNTFAKSVQLSAYTATQANNWKRYSIPFSDLVGVDFSDVSYLGFYTPVDVNKQPIYGTLYFDELFLDKPGCTATGSIAFDQASYAQNAAQASFSLTDLCGANKRNVVKVSNGSDEIAIGLVTDSAGKASAQVNFGSTSDVSKTLAVQNGNVLSATFVDANANPLSATTSITAASP